MIRVLDDDNQIMETALAVQHGATPADWEAAAAEERYVELIDGVMIMHAAVSLTHDRLFDFVYRLLGDYVERRGLGQVHTGPFTMELALERKFEPDIMFLTAQTAANLAEDRLRGPADLAIEIASPSTRGYDRGAKRECYRVGGVREYWMIDPSDKVVAVDRPAGHDVASASSGRVESDLCPGFWVDAAWLWREPLPTVHECLEALLNEPTSGS